MTDCNSLNVKREKNRISARFIHITLMSHLFITYVRQNERLMKRVL